MRLLVLMFALVDGLRSNRYSNVGTVSRGVLNHLPKNGMLMLSTKDIQNEVTSMQPAPTLMNGGNFVFAMLAAGAICTGLAFPVAKVNAVEMEVAPAVKTTTVAEEKYNDKGELIVDEKYDMGTFKLPYNHENLKFKDFLGKRATIVFNMKIDDPQTVTQFPNLLEIYQKYVKEGLNVHAFPTEQGWFEPDDDETVRAKSKEYYGFGNYPTSVVFDKVVILGATFSIFLGYRFELVLF